NEDVTFIHFMVKEINKWDNIEQFIKKLPPQQATLLYKYGVLLPPIKRNFKLYELREILGLLGIEYERCDFTQWKKATKVLTTYPAKRLEGITRTQEYSLPLKKNLVLGKVQELVDGLGLKYIDNTFTLWKKALSWMAMEIPEEDHERILAAYYSKCLYSRLNDKALLRKICEYGVYEVKNATVEFRDFGLLEEEEIIYEEMSRLDIEVLEDIYNYTNYYIDRLESFDDVYIYDDEPFNTDLEVETGDYDDASEDAITIGTQLYVDVLEYISIHKMIVDKRTIMDALFQVNQELENAIDIRNLILETLNQDIQYSEKEEKRFKKLVDQFYPIITRVGGEISLLDILKNIKNITIVSALRFGKYMDDEEIIKFVLIKSMLKAEESGGARETRDCKTAIIKYIEVKQKLGTIKEISFEKMARDLSIKREQCEDSIISILEQEAIKGVAAGAGKVILGELQSDDKISIIRGMDHAGGSIRYKLGLKNVTKYKQYGIEIDLDAEETMFYVKSIYPAEFKLSLKECRARIPSIEPGGTTGIEFMLEPRNCGSSTIQGSVKFKDERGEMQMLRINPLKVHIECPILLNPGEINVARIDTFLNRITPVPEKYLITKDDPRKIFLKLCESIRLNHSDFFHVETEANGSPIAWFYATSLKHKQPIAIRVSLDGNQILMEVGSSKPEEAVGLIAKIRSNLESLLEGRNVGDILTRLDSLEANLKADHAGLKQDHDEIKNKLVLLVMKETNTLIELNIIKDEIKEKVTKLMKDEMDLQESGKNDESEIVSAELQRTKDDFKEQVKQINEKLESLSGSLGEIIDNNQYNLDRIESMLVGMFKGDWDRIKDAWGRYKRKEISFKELLGAGVKGLGKRLFKKFVTVVSGGVVDFGKQYLMDKSLESLSRTRS
ncbi:MAG: hypothetical protein ACTSUE_24965, partial [Promethearchaeota archaeon]